MSHYPSTAELAAFRRAIDPTACDHSMTPVWRLPNGGWSDGAWSWEKERGIGKHDRDAIPCRERHVWRGPCAVEAGDRYSRSIREAGAIRTRAYEASRCPVCGYANLPDSAGCLCYGGCACCGCGCGATDPDACGRMPAYV